MNVDSDSNNVVHLEVGKLYMLSPDSHRDWYWLYGNALDTARVNVAEPFLVIGPNTYIKPGIVLPMVTVCNARGETGYICDRVNTSFAFVPYTSVDEVGR